MRCPRWEGGVNATRVRSFAGRPAGLPACPVGLFGDGRNVDTVTLEGRSFPGLIFEASSQDFSIVLMRPGRPDGRVNIASVRRPTILATAGDASDAA